MSVMREAGEMRFYTLPYHFRSQVRLLDYTVPFQKSSPSFRLYHSISEVQSFTHYCSISEV